MNKEELIEKAYDVRKNVLRMGHVDKRGFIAQSLGAADFLTVLYFHAMKYHADDPKWEGRDRFLLSAGHNAIAVYAAMAEAGFFPKDWLDTYGLDNSRLPMSCMPAYESIGNLASLTSLANIEAAPYLYSGTDHWRAVWEGEVGQGILQQMGDDCGMVIMGAGLQGIRMMCSNKRIETPADVAGFKLRVPTIPIYLDTWTWLGATPTPLGGSEVFTAIQQGTVNGAENGLTNIASLSWDECTKYIVETKHVYNTDSFIMDKTYFEALPEEYQTIIRDAAVEAGKRCTDLVLEANESIRPEVEAADCEFIETDVTLWQEALDGFLEEKYPDLVSYADQIKAADPT